MSDLAKKLSDEQIREKGKALFSLADEDNRKRLEFIVEMDKMKSIVRHSLLVDQSRAETDAEHSWQLAMMALVLAPEAPEGTDIFKVVVMCLVHDIVEIYAGDTYAYDKSGYESKTARELESADKLYAMLPGSEGARLRAYWEEFEAMETPEALFANALDRLQPMMLNAFSDGQSWVSNQVTVDDVLKRALPIRTDLPRLWPMMENLIRTSYEKGLLL